MTTHATGTFHNTGWDETPLDPEDAEAGPPRLTRARISQRFSGDIEADGTWDAVMCYRPDGTAVYAGYLRLDGRIGSRSGSVVLEAHGTYDGTEARTAWLVVPGTAGGELGGLSGEGSAVAPHGPDGTYDFDYELT
jgi:Protein of unknown function (DUF3224)